MIIIISSSLSSLYINIHHPPKPKRPNTHWQKYFLSCIMYTHLYQCVSCPVCVCVHTFNFTIFLSISIHYSVKLNHTSVHPKQEWGRKKKFISNHLLSKTLICPLFIVLYFPLTSHHMDICKSFIFPFLLHLIPYPLIFYLSFAYYEFCKLNWEFGTVSR